MYASFCLSLTSMNLPLSLSSAERRARLLVSPPGIHLKQTVSVCGGCPYPKFGGGGIPYPPPNPNRGTCCWNPNCPPIQCPFPARKDPIGQAQANPPYWFWQPKLQLPRPSWHSSTSPHPPRVFIKPLEHPHSNEP